MSQTNLTDPDISIPLCFKMLKPVEYQIRLTFQNGAKIMTMDEDIKIYMGRLIDKTEVQYENMIKFDNAVVSKNHAHLAIKGVSKTLCIKDTGSTLGTYLNKTRLSATGEESDWVELISGDKVVLGADQVINGDKIQAIQIEFEISRFEGKEMKVFIEDDEEEAPLSPIITSKEFKKQQKTNPTVETKKRSSIQVLAGKSDLLPNLSTVSVAEPLENGNSPNGSIAQKSKVSLFSQFQLFSTSPIKKEASRKRL